MKRVLITVAAVGAVLLGLVGVAIAATSGPGRAAHAAGRRPPVVYDGLTGWQRGRARPPAIYIGESDVFLRVPHWARWSGSSASAQAVLWVNTCTPTCSAGHYRTYPASVSLAGVAEHGDVRYFSRMQVSYWHGSARDYAYQWGELPGASIPGWNGGPG